MIPLRVRLKGFKGIRSAWGVDEIDIDLSRLPKGLIAITGPIGSGKTTLLDNLHPYRIMPYRAGDYSERSFSFYQETYG
ncbi:MAG: AAA family ATPase, partial [Nitrospirales bacterium]|nr:AAA family ATPase [Nitrospirales bacterium]